VESVTNACCCKHVGERGRLVGNGRRDALPALERWHWSRPLNHLGAASLFLAILLSWRDGGWTCDHVRSAHSWPLHWPVLSAFFSSAHKVNKNFAQTIGRRDDGIFKMRCGHRYRGESCFNVLTFQRPGTSGTIGVEWGVRWLSLSCLHGAICCARAQRNVIARFMPLWT